LILFYLLSDSQEEIDAIPDRCDRSGIRSLKMAIIFF
jgi:hypothetical protein